MKLKRLSSKHATEIAVLPAADAVKIGGYLVAAVLLGTGYQLWQDGGTNLHAPAMAVSLGCYVVAFVVATVASLEEISSDVKIAVAVGALASSFVAYAACYLAYRFSSYGTDALLFSAYSAELVRHGVNPYAQTMQPAFDLFDASTDLVTPKADGGAVFAQSYPALNFLLYVPFVFLNLNALWLSVIAHVAIILLLVAAAPHALKIFVGLFLFVDPSYVNYTLGSVTDVVWALPMVVCARFWRSNYVVAALALGIACGIKQTPWFVVPFALVHWGKWAYAQRRPFEFIHPVCVLLLTFLLPNTPFIIADAQLWFAGVMTPIGGNLIAFGSGIVQLVTSNSYPISSRALLKISLATYGTLLAAYAFSRRRLQFVPFIAPPIALFFASRSLQNYFMFWPLILAAFAFSPIREEHAAVAVSGWVRRHSLAAASLALVVLIVGGATVRASLAAPPIRLDVLKYTIDSRTHNIDSVAVEIANGSEPRSIRFGIVTSGMGIRFGYWHTATTRFGPEERRTVVVRAPRIDQEVTPGKVELQVVAIDARDGNQTFSNAVATAPDDGAFANGDFAAWTNGAAGAPLGWIATSPDGANRISRVRSNRQTSIRIVVAPPKDAQWKVQSLSQTILGMPRDLLVDIKPDRSFEGGMYPHQIFGLELVDSLGHHAYYTISSQIYHPEIYHRDQFTFFVQPGVTGAWNTIRVDPAELVRESQFLIDGRAQIEFRILGAAHGGSASTLAGTVRNVRFAP